MTVPDTASQPLSHLLEVFDSLNPEMVALVEPALFAAGRRFGPDDFATVTRKAEEILASYLASPVKRAETAMLHEYYYFVDRVAKRMLTESTLTRPAGAPANPGCLALVPEHFYSSLQWCRVAASPEIPLDVRRAVDAAQRRNLLVDSVLEPLFRLQLRLDAEQAFAWQLALGQRPDRPPDPDVARDLLRAWCGQPELPGPVLARAMLWSEDQKSFRHWPAVTQEADRLLRQQGLARHFQRSPPRSALAARLHLLAPYDHAERLRAWLRRAIQQLGDCVAFFARVSDAVNRADPGAAATQAWRQAALFRELVWLQQILPLLLLLADLLLASPNGAYEFAMAVFGFTREERAAFHERLYRECRQVVHRRFLDDLRRQRPVTETIKALCFGDEDYERLVLGELDFALKEFDSYRQRDLVVDKLAVMYASYRENEALAKELARRYRRLMRVLHEDHLRRVLSPEQFAQTRDLGPVLLDLATIAAGSRRFLEMRRAVDRSIEEIIAADMDFTATIRGLRARQVHQLFGL